MLLSKSDCVENFLHSLIDQFCDAQPDKGHISNPFQLCMMHILLNYPLNYLYYYVKYI